MRTIIWDFDDTLGFRDGTWGATLVCSARQVIPEISVTLEQLRPHLTTGFPWHNPEIPHDHITDAEAWWNGLMIPILAGVLRNAGVPSPQAEAVAHLVRQEYPRLERWSLYPETASVLELMLQHGWRHIILSNHVPELPMILEHLGIGRYVADVVNSATIGFEKPHPSAFASALKLCDEGEVWMIGDNFIADIQGAAAVGIPGILVRKPHPKAALYADNLCEIMAIVEGEKKR